MYDIIYKSIPTSLFVNNLPIIDFWDNQWFSRLAIDRIDETMFI